MNPIGSSTVATAFQRTLKPQPKSGRRVLVLMATFNGASHLATQLRSILSQSNVYPTVFLRDDGSTDQTLEVVEATDLKANVQVLRAPSPSGSAAQNFFAIIQAADSTEYDFVALADQDDIWHPKKLERAAATLEKHGADGYSAAVSAFWPSGRTMVLTQSAQQTSADYLFEGAGQGCTFVLTRAFFVEVQQKLGQHRVALAALHYHDWAIYALCRVAGKRWVFDPVVCLDYRQHESNDTGARWSPKAIKRRVELIRSGWYGRQINAIVNLCIIAGEEDAKVQAKAYFDLQSAAKQSLVGRLTLLRFLLYAGRRSLPDRLVLTSAALCGYLDEES